MDMSRTMFFSSNRFPSNRGIGCVRMPVSLYVCIIFLDMRSRLQINVQCERRSVYQIVLLLSTSLDECFITILPLPSAEPKQHNYQKISAKNTPVMVKTASRQLQLASDRSGQVVSRAVVAQLVRA